MIGRRRIRVIAVAFASAVVATYVCAQAEFSYLLSQSAAFTLAGLVLAVGWPRR